MKKGLLFAFLSVAAFAGCAFGQVVVNNAFTGGEKLYYTATYKIGIASVDLATISIETTIDSVSGKNAYKINAIGKILPDYEWFYKMRDKYTVWLDKTSLKPLLFKNDISEGDYHYWSTYRYDWDNMQVTTVERRDKWKEDKVKTYSLYPTSYDALSLFYNLRTRDISAMKVGVREELKLVFANRIRVVGLTYKGKESKRIPGLGKVDAIKFECGLANDSGVSFEDGSFFTIWLSDDENKIPLYIETPIKVGSVRVRLTNCSGLKNPTRIKAK